MAMDPYRLIPARREDDEQRPDPLSLLSQVLAGKTDFSQLPGVAGAQSLLSGVTSGTGNFLTGALDVVDRPRAAVMGGVRAMLRGEDVGSAVGRGLGGEEHILASQIMEEQNIGSEDRYNLGPLSVTQRDVLGFGADVLADPLNLLTFGAGSGAKIAATTAMKEATRLGRGAMEITAAGKAAEATARASRPWGSTRLDVPLSATIQRRVLGQEAAKDVSMEILPFDPLSVVGHGIGAAVDAAPGGSALKEMVSRTVGELFVTNFAVRKFEKKIREATGLEGTPELAEEVRKVYTSKRVFEGEREKMMEQVVLRMSSLTEEERLIAKQNIERGTKISDMSARAAPLDAAMYDASDDRLGSLSGLTAAKEAWNRGDPNAVAMLAAARKEAIRLKARMEVAWLLRDAVREQTPIVDLRRPITVKIDGHPYTVEPAELHQIALDLGATPSNVATRVNASGMVVPDVTPVLVDGKRVWQVNRAPAAAPPPAAATRSPAAATPPGGLPGMPPVPTPPVPPPLSGFFEPSLAIRQGMTRTTGNEAVDTFMAWYQDFYRPTRDTLVKKLGLESFLDNYLRHVHLPKYDDTGALLKDAEGNPMKYDTRLAKALGIEPGQPVRRDPKPLQYRKAKFYQRTGAIGESDDPMLAIFGEELALQELRTRAVTNDFMRGLVERLKVSGNVRELAPGENPRAFFDVIWPEGKGNPYDIWVLKAAGRRQLQRDIDVGAVMPGESWADYAARINPIARNTPPGAAPGAAPIPMAQAGSDLGPMRGPNPNQIQAFSNTTPGLRYDFDVEVVPIDTLVASHTPDFHENPAFNQELQNRLRARAASQMQVQNIMANLDPMQLLAPSVRLDTGPMIVGADNMVEAGNGRVLALQKAMAEAPDKWRNYQDQLRQIAPYYGIDPASLPENGVLVRRRTTNLDDAARASFAEEANTAPTATLGPYETARTQADNLPPDLVQRLEVGEEDDIFKILRRAGNGDIIRTYVASLPVGARSGVVDEHGVLTGRGYQELANALLVQAYRGEEGKALMSTLSEAAVTKIERVRDAIYDSMPGIASLESRILNEQLEATRHGTAAILGELTIAEDIAKAANTLARLRANGEDVGMFLRQMNMFDPSVGAMSEPWQQLLGLFGAPNQSAAGIRRVLDRYAELANGQHAVPQGQGAFAGFDELLAPKTKQGLLDQAMEGARVVDTSGPIPAAGATLSGTPPTGRAAPGASALTGTGIMSTREAQDAAKAFRRMMDGGLAGERKFKAWLAAHGGDAGGKTREDYRAAIEAAISRFFGDNQHTYTPEHIARELNTDDLFNWRFGPGTATPHALDIAKQSAPRHIHKAIGGAEEAVAGATPPPGAAAGGTGAGAPPPPFPPTPGSGAGAPFMEPPTFFDPGRRGTINDFLTKSKGFKAGRRLEVPLPIAKMVNMLDKEEDKLLFFKGLDTLQGIWKMSVTTIWPGFHMRNLTSSVFMNWQQGISTLEVYEDALKIQRAGQHWIGSLGKPLPGEEALGVSANGRLVPRGTEGAMDLSEFLLQTRLRGGLDAGFYGMEVPALIGREVTEGGTTERVAGALTGPGAAMAGVARKLGASEKTQTMLSHINMAYMGRMAGLAIEDNVRIANVLGRMRLGDTFDQAVQSMRQWQIDYGDLTPTERKLRSVVPFWSWTRRSVPNQLGKLAEEPRQAALVSKLANSLESDEGLSDGEKSLMGNYVMERFGLVIGRDEEGLPKVVNSVGLPMEDLTTLFKRTPGRTVDGWLGMMGPLLRMPLEAMFNHSTFTGRAINDENYQNAYRSIYPAIAELPGLKDWLNITETKVTTRDGAEKTYYNADPWKMYLMTNVIGRLYYTAGKATDDRKAWSDRVFNILTGSKVTSVDVERAAVATLRGEWGFAQQRVMDERGTILNDAAGGVLKARGISQEVLARSAYREQRSDAMQEGAAKLEVLRDEIELRQGEGSRAKTAAIAAMRDPVDMALTAYHGISAEDPKFRDDLGNPDLKLFLRARDAFLAGLEPSLRGKVQERLLAYIDKLPPDARKVEREYQTALANFKVYQGLRPFQSYVSEENLEKMRQLNRDYLALPDTLERTRYMNRLPGRERDLLQRYFSIRIHPSLERQRYEKAHPELQRWGFIK